MSGYLVLWRSVPATAKLLSEHYGMPVSEQKVRRVFDAICKGRRAWSDGPRLIAQCDLDAIMEAIEDEEYVPKVTAERPRIAEIGDCKPPTTPQELPLTHSEEALESRAECNQHPLNPSGRRPNRR